MEIYQYSIYELDEFKKQNVEEITIIEKGQILKRPIKELVVEKMNLVKKVLYHLNIPTRYLNDYVDLGYIFLIEALTIYDYKKYQKLDSYLITAIKNRFFNEFDKNQLDPHFNSVSYDVCIDDNDNTIGDLIADSVDFVDDVTKNEEIDIILELLNQRYLFKKREKEIYCKFYGIRCPSYSAKELAEKYNMSTNTITKLVSRINNDLKNLTTKYRVIDN